VDLACKRAHIKPPPRAGLKDVKKCEHALKKKIAVITEGFRPFAGRIRPSHAHCGKKAIFLKNLITKSKSKTTKDPSLHDVLSFSSRYPKTAALAVTAK
jgi:hypothetical protein